MLLVKVFGNAIMRVDPFALDFWEYQFKCKFQVIGKIESRWIIVDFTQPETSMRNAEEGTNGAVAVETFPLLSMVKFRPDWDNYLIDCLPGVPKKLS